MRDAHLDDDVTFLSMIKLKSYLGQGNFRGYERLSYSVYYFIFHLQYHLLSIFCFFYKVSLFLYFIRCTNFYLTYSFSDLVFFLQWLILLFFYTFSYFLYYLQRLLFPCFFYIAFPFLISVFFCFFYNVSLSISLLFVSYILPPFYIFSFYIFLL